MEFNIVIRTPDILEAAKLIGAAIGGSRMIPAETGAPAAGRGGKKKNDPDPKPAQDTATEQLAAQQAVQAAQLAVQQLPLQQPAVPPQASGPVPAGWPMTQEQYAAAQQAAANTLAGYPTGMPGVGAPVPNPAYAQAQPLAPQAPVQPQAQPPLPNAGQAHYTMPQLVVAATPLLDAGKGPQLQAMLAKFGVPQLNMIQPNFYDAVAVELRQLGAQI